MSSADFSTPADVRLRLKEQELRITWADGRVSVYPLAYLRANCPCAACRAEREQREKTALPVLSPRGVESVKAVDGGLVGNYAIQITWSDGHNTGIFDFRYLRQLDEGR